MWAERHRHWEAIDRQWDRDLSDHGPTRAAVLYYTRVWHLDAYYSEIIGPKFPSAHD